MAEAPSPPTILFPASNTGGWQPVNVIVIHSAVMDLYCGAATDLSNYGKTSSGLSWHYSIDNCETFQNVWDNTVAWHDGMNYGHIGIEMAEYPKTKVGRVLPGRWAGRKHQDLLRRTAELTRQLCLFYDVPMVKLSRADVAAGKRGICGHFNIPRRYTSHWDPGLFPWKKFMAQVKGEKMIVTKRGARKIVNELLATDVFVTPWGNKKNPTWNFQNMQESQWRQSWRTENAVAGLAAAVEALSTDADLTAERVEQIVRDAVQQSIEITGTVEVSGEEQA